MWSGRWGYGDGVGTPILEVVGKREGLGEKLDTVLGQSSPELYSVACMPPPLLFFNSPREKGASPAPSLIPSGLTLGAVGSGQPKQHGGSQGWSWTLKVTGSLWLFLAVSSTSLSVDVPGMGPVGGERDLRSGPAWVGSGPAGTQEHRHSGWQGNAGDGLGGGYLKHSAGGQ